METLKSLRNRNDLTQKELSSLFGVSDRTIYNIEKDSSNIGDRLLSKYMLAFEVKYDDIFLGNEYEIFVFKEANKKRIIKNLNKEKEVTHWKK